MEGKLPSAPARLNPVRIADPSLDRLCLLAGLEDFVSAEHPRLPHSATLLGRMEEGGLSAYAGDGVFGEFGVRFGHRGWEGAIEMDGRERH